MKITSKTKWTDVAPLLPFLTDESKKALREAAVQQYGDYWTLTIDQLFDLMGGDYSHVGDLREPTALQAEWLEGLKDFIETLTKLLEKYTPPVQPEAKRASAGCLPMTMQESVLVFCRSYFGLPSFEAVGKLTIAEFLLARKDNYNNRLAQYNFDMMQRAKLKTK